MHLANLTSATKAKVGDNHTTGREIFDLITKNGILYSNSHLFLNTFSIDD